MRDIAALDVTYYAVVTVGVVVLATLFRRAAEIVREMKGGR